jgi:hypothetical protein
MGAFFYHQHRTNPFLWSIETPLTSQNHSFFVKKNHFVAVKTFVCILFHVEYVLNDWECSLKFWE